MGFLYLVSSGIMGGSIFFIGGADYFLLFGGGSGEQYLSPGFEGSMPRCCDFRGYFGGGLCGVVPIFV
jgi:hypothetical protein